MTGVTPDIPVAGGAVAAPGILLDAVTYRYAGAGRPSLACVSLELGPGDVVGVVGANESGKTTLCLVVSGLAPAVIGGHLEGTVAIDGAPTAKLRPHEAAQRCGLLFQNPTTQLSGTTATVFEEVAFAPRNLGLPLPEIVVRVRESLAALGVESLAARDPSRLSGGQAQLVALASVLALRPAYLVLDEPTSQLDPLGTRLVADALAGLAAKTKTGILIAEHKTDVLERIAGRVAVLDRGTVALGGTAAEVLADPRLPELGIEPPSRVRLARTLEARGIGEAAVASALAEAVS